jgi:hypothetical protein
VRQLLVDEEQHRRGYKPGANADDGACSDDAEHHPF